MTSAKKVVILVSGGVVQSVHADGNIEVEIIDFDDLEAAGVTYEGKEAFLNSAIADMQEVA